MTHPTRSPKYVFKRVCQLAWPYRYLAALGIVCLGIMTTTLSALAALLTPIVNMATQSQEAGINSFNNMKRLANEVLTFLPLREWGLQFLSWLPADWVQQFGPRETVTVMFLLVVGFFCALTVGTFQYLGYYFTHLVAMRIKTDIRNQFNQVLIRQHYGFYDRFKPGELMSKVQNDIEYMSTALTFVFNQMPKGCIMILYGIAFSFIKAPALTVGLLLLPIFISPLRALGKRIKKSANKTLQKLGDLTDVLHQQIGGIREIQGHNLEDSKQNEFTSTNEGVYRGLMGIVRARGLSRAVVEGGGYVVVLLITVFAAILVKLTGLQFGQIATFSFVITALVWQPLRTLSKAYNDFQNALPGASNILDILDHPEPVEESTSPQPFPKDIRSISYSQVSYRYTTGPQVLDRVTFDVDQGQVVALVGHTGSGKSTLMDFLPRFRDPLSGSVSINDIDVRNLSLKELRAHVALVNQDPYIFNSSIRDNLLMGHPQASDEELWQILDQVKLGTLLRNKKEGLDFKVGERGVNLSGGQRQRLAIARTLLKNAPILILDEATSSQDSVTEKEIQEALHVLMKGRTTFIIAHRLTTVDHADVILVLKNGQLVEKGTPQTLKNQGGEYATLYATQFAK